MNQDHSEIARSSVLSCFDENQIIREDTVRKLSRLIEGWMDIAAQHCLNESFYRDLLNKCAENLGPVQPKVFVQDDGGIVDEPLRVKLPELVKELARMSSEYLASRSSQKEGP